MMKKNLSGKVSEAFRKYRTSILIASCIAAAACGKKSDDEEGQAVDVTALSLDALPDMSKAAASSSTGFQLAVTGTPKKLYDLASTDINTGTCKNWDKYFFNCAVSAVNTAGTATADQKGAIQRGEAVMRNAGMVAETMRQLGGGTMCYMGQLPKVDATTTVISKEGKGITAASYGDLFKPGTEAKLIQINPTVSGSTQENIYVEVPSSSTASSSGSLEIKFSYCNSDKSVRGTESIKIDASSGLLTSTTTDTFSNSGYTGKKNRVLKLYMKKVGTDYQFDLTKDRTISGSQYDSGSFGTNTSAFSFTLDKDNFLSNTMNSKSTFTFNGASQTGSQKLYSKTLISGDDGKSLSIPQVGMSMVFTQGTNSFSPKGAVEWNTDTYADTKTSSLYTTANSYAFTDAIFTTDPTSPSQTFSADACTRTPDVTVKFVMDTTAGKGVRTKCEGSNDDKMRALFDLSNNSDLMNARSKTFN